MQGRVAARKELRDHLAGQHDDRAVRQGEQDLALDHGDLGAPEIEGEAQDRIGSEIDFDPIARRRLGNDEWLALLRQRGDLGGGVDECQAERIARGPEPGCPLCRGSAP